MIPKSIWLMALLALVSAGCLDMGDESESNRVEACPCGLQWDVMRPNEAAAHSSVVVEPSDTIWEILYNPSSNHDRPEAVVVDGSYVYVAGTDQEFTQADQQWRFVKFNKNTAEPIWIAVENPNGDQGPVSGGCDRLFDMTLHDGWLYVAGADSTDPVRCSLRVEKRSAQDGSLIWSSTDQSGGVGSLAHGIAADDTSVYVAGRDSDEASNARWRIERRDAETGKVIWQVIENHEPDDDQVTELALFDGHLYLAGYTSNHTVENGWSWRVEKRKAIDGELVWAIDDGVPSYPYTLFRDVAVDQTGVYLVGVDTIGIPPDINQLFFLQRRSLEDGSLIWSTTSDQSEVLDSAVALAMDAEHVYITGKFDSPPPVGRYLPDQKWRVEKYVKATGDLVWSRALNPSPYRDAPRAIAVDEASVFVVGQDASLLENEDQHDHQWRIEAYSK